MERSGDRVPARPGSDGGGEVGERTRDVAARRLERERDQVLGAILLASRGPFDVTLANFADAETLAAELRPDALHKGVEILVEGPCNGPAVLRVHRR
jgi:hypothetical protein